MKQLVQKNGPTTNHPPKTISSPSGRLMKQLVQKNAPPTNHPPKIISSPPGRIGPSVPAKFQGRPWNSRTSSMSSFMPWNLVSDQCLSTSVCL
ncbi:hypothetical protein M430DRAFT_36688 [Amorphotheca resinae ATCC 22711]|jgi:hypothetical protein|uniref:Uncharacterized protein n=1 Tax=Amorphotheca resinae ATCC 22711 TaxID=857342 RepID=A0A2T3AVB3_AMORE|nr:hypothetical protein M430DRAFT_36688 [Amorphotheca resinae ATCC 22711]PSS12605.1 hypothetical protein M430DRAFT_36688 [Amorphotheca resinae ATCC 22711]